LDDVLNPAMQDAAKARIYWFMRDLGGGQRTLNRVGYYYVALNFSLLFLTLLGVACFLSLTAEVMRAGSAEDPNRIDSFDVLHVKLQSFTDVYLLMKGLAATYTVNFYVWAVSPLGKTENLLAAEIALTVVGVFFIAVPRQYIELKWFELWHKSGKPFEYRETRSPEAKRWGGFLDALFITSILSAWRFDFPSIAKWFSE
jgi:membrane-associated phospholipid phosphatase